MFRNLGKQVFKMIIRFQIIDFPDDGVYVNVKTIKGIYSSNNLNSEYKFLLLLAFLTV